jgi:ParB-like nuclease domain
MFAKILKVNPYHDATGAFSTKDAATVYSGAIEAFHGTAATDYILKQGFVLGSPGSTSGKGRAVMGEGVYLSDSRDFAHQYGEVLGVETQKVKLKTVTMEDIYQARTAESSRLRRNELENAWKGDWASTPDYAPQVIREHFQKLGYDGVRQKFPGNKAKGIPSSTHTVIFDPSKFTSIAKDANTGPYLTKTVPASVKKAEFAKVLKANPYHAADGSFTSKVYAGKHITEEQRQSKDSQDNPYFDAKALALTKGVTLARGDFNKIAVTKVKLSSLVSSQPDVNPRKVKRIAAEYDKKDETPILVVHHAGKYLLWDGNHRVNAADTAGLKELPAQVMELDTMLKTTPTTKKQDFAGVLKEDKKEWQRGTSICATHPDKLRASDCMGQGTRL